MKRLLHPIYMAYCKALEIAVGRKFLILLLSSYLLSKGYLTGTEFIPVALAVLGAQWHLDNKNPPRTFNADDTSVPGATAG